MSVFYANNSAHAQRDRHGDVHLILYDASEFGFGGAQQAVLPRRVAEQLLKKLAEALMPDEPEDAAPEQQEELPVTGGFSEPAPVEQDWREQFGVGS